MAGETAPKVRDRSRAIRLRVRELNRPLATRTGQGKTTALKLTAEAGEQVTQTVCEARRLTGRCASALAAAAPVA